MFTKCEIQFRGYQATKLDLPATASPFERIDDIDAANDLIQQTLGGDEDEAGWIAGDADGEDFQVRAI